MPARKRKKPPDPSSFSLQSSTCLTHGHPADLSCPFLRLFSPILALGKRFGLVPESLRSFARPSAEVLARLGVCPCNRFRVATSSVFGCRPSPNYCVLTGPTSYGLRSRVTCTRSKVRIAIWLEVVFSRNRTFDSYGKGVLGGCLFSGSCEVWTSISLIFWLSLFLGELTMLFWQYVCLCCWWKFLFAMSLSCYTSLCDRSSCGYEFTCLWWVSLFQTGVVIYFPAQLAMFIISLWMHLLGSDLLHNLLIKVLYAAIVWDPAVMCCVQHLGLAVWVRIRWVLNPKWSLCFLMFWSIIPLCFVSLVLRLGYWGSVLPACTAYVEVYERSYAMYSLAFLFPSLSLSVSWLFLVLQWLNFRSLLLLSFVTISVKWVHRFCLVSNHCYIVCCLHFNATPVNFNSIILFGCVHRVPLHQSSPISLFSRGCTFCMELYICMVSLFLCILTPPPQGDKFNYYLMKLSANFSEAAVALSLYWVIPYLLLFLVLVSMFAQDHEPLAACSCWQLFFFQAIGDEVKGIYPLAYEDLSTEAMFFAFLFLFQQGGVQCPFFFWHLFLFQLLRDDIQFTWATPGYHVLRPRLWLKDRKIDSGVQCSLIGSPSFA